jgi:ABC-type protease/lipase transport system fused ATPase/permease subunit
MKANLCFWERVADEVLGIIFLGIALLFLVISFTVLPVFGLFIAIPALVLAVAFLAAKRSKACQLISESTRNVLPKSKPSQGK